MNYDYEQEPKESFAEALLTGVLMALFTVFSTALLAVILA